MNELNYTNRHFVSGSFTGTYTNAQKLSLPLLATLNFDVEKGTVAGTIENHDSGKIDVAGEFNKNAPYDFKLVRADTTYFGFKQNENLVGRYKNAGGKGVFKLTPERIIAAAKSQDQDLGQEDTIQELISMGFSEEAVRQAVVVEGLSLSEATDRLVNPDESKASPELLIERFKGMGFDMEKIQRAVSQCEGKEEVALQMLLGEE
eukprot:TRINITY_DN16051_c0_g1_i2.p1 TRINITY_DN16051_c0_g1~~TRINITY_DN16051_c0_g1_i2.p1  ORF type:complete len:240 (+),score=70.23 TRINITY_DN16051_c0_g1_i2:107-721(+)